MIYAFLTTLFFSVSAISGSRLSRRINPLRANFLRLSVAFVFLAFYSHLFGQGFGGPALFFFLLSGVIGFGFGDIGLYLAYPLLGARLTILIVQCLAAPIGMITEWLWLGTRMTGLQMGAMLIILIGVALAVAPSKTEAIKVKFVFRGSVLALFGALGQGWGAVITRKANQVAESAGVMIDGITAAYQRLSAGLAIALIYLIIHKWKKSGEEKTPTPSIFSGHILILVLIAGLSGPALGVSCYQAALKQYPTGIVLAIAALTPLVVMPLAYFIDGERPSARSVVGGFIAVGGAVFLAFCN